MAWIASREAQSADEVRRHEAWYDRVMTDIAADPWVLCEVVGAGPARWRTQFVTTMREAGLPLVTDAIADRLFAFFCQRLQQISESTQAPDHLATWFLDHLQVDTPHVPTEQEINESWALESASSPEGQRFAYGGKTTDEVMRGLAGEIAPTFTHDES